MNLQAGKGLTTHELHKLSSRSLDRILGVLSQRQLLRVMFRSEDVYERATSARVLHGISCRLFFLKIQLPGDDFDYFANCFDELETLQLFDGPCEATPVDLTRLRELFVYGSCERIAFLLSKCIYCECGECCDGPSVLRFRVVDAGDGAASGRLLYLVSEAHRCYVRELSLNCYLTKFEKNVLRYFQNLAKLDLYITDNFNLVIDLPELSALQEFSLTKQILNMCEIVDLLAAMPNLQVLRLRISLFQYTDLDMLGQHVHVDSSVAADRVKLDALSTKQKAAKVMRAQGHLRQIDIFSISALPVDLFILMFHCQNALADIQIAAQLVQSEQTAENCVKAEKWAGSQAIALIRKTIHRSPLKSRRSWPLLHYFDLAAFDDYYHTTEAQDDICAPAGTCGACGTFRIPYRASFEASDASTTDGRSESYYDSNRTHLTQKLERSVSKSVFYVGQDVANVDEPEETTSEYEESMSGLSAVAATKDSLDTAVTATAYDFGVPSVKFCIYRDFEAQRTGNTTQCFTGDDLMLNSSPVRIAMHPSAQYTHETVSSNEFSCSAYSGVYASGTGMYDVTNLIVHSRSMFNLRYLMQDSIHYFQYRIKDVAQYTTSNWCSNTYTGRQLDTLHENASKLPFCKIGNTESAELLIKKLNACISQENIQKYSTQSLKRLKRLFSSDAIESQGYNSNSSVFECASEMDVDARSITQYIRQDRERLERDHFAYKVFNDAAITNFYHSISRHTAADQVDEPLDIAVDYKMPFYYYALPDCMYGILLNNRDFQYTETPYKLQSVFEDLDGDQNFQFSLVVFLLSIPQNVMRVDLKKVLFTQTTFSMLLDSLSNLLDLSIQELPIFSTSQIKPSASVRRLKLYNQGYLNVEQLPRVFPALETLDVSYLILSDYKCGSMTLRTLRVANSCNLSPLHLRVLCEASAETLYHITLHYSPIALFGRYFGALRELYCSHVLCPFFKIGKSGLQAGQHIFLLLMQVSPCLQFAEYSESRYRYYDKSVFADCPELAPVRIPTLLRIRVPASLVHLASVFAPAGATVESFPL